MNNINQPNILVCDDSSTNVLILSTLLETELKVQVHKETDPRKILPLIQEKEFDLFKELAWSAGGGW